jgi:hypothetical protein
VIHEPGSSPGNQPDCFPNLQMLDTILNINYDTLINN